MSSSCKKCGSYIHQDNQIECWQCKDFGDDQGDVLHDSFIRCPKCKASFEAHESADDIYEDGVHDVDCPECDFSFEVITSVSHTFESPPLQSDSEVKKPDA